MSTTEMVIDYNAIEDDDTASFSNVRESLSPLISEETKDIITFINLVVICQIVALFGVGSNIVNMIVFYKMGFKDSINVSLFSLAISDFLSSVTAVFNSASYTIHHLDLDLSFKPFDVNYLVGGYAHVIALKLTGCLTAYIAFERCLCVTFPLKVKHIVTPKRVLTIIACFWVLVLGLFAPGFYNNRLVWKFDPYLNKTLLSLTFINVKAELSFRPYRAIALPLITFFVAILSTVILVVSLMRKSEWRSKNAGGDSKSTHVSSRDAKVAKLVVFVSVFFIACFTPQTFISLLMETNTDYSYGGRYTNMVSTLFAFIYILDSVNASLNIFIYYYRSSAYKSVFEVVILRKKTSCK